MNSNIATLQLKNATVKHGDSLTLLDNNAENDKFDLVFVDPPFRQNLAEKSCFLLESNHWLTEQALIYVEVESELSNLDTPDNWLLLKEKTAGQVICRLYQRETN